MYNTVLQYYKCDISCLFLIMLKIGLRIYLRASFFSWRACPQTHPSLACSAGIPRYRTLLAHSLAMGLCQIMHFVLLPFFLKRIVLKYNTCTAKCSNNENFLRKSSFACAYKRRVSGPNEIQNDGQIQNEDKLLVLQASI